MGWLSYLKPFNVFENTIILSQEDILNYYYFKEHNILWLSAVSTYIMSV